LLARWKEKNTGNWIARTEAYAETICEAVLNVTDCWFDDSIFDSKYEAAIRSWAQQSPEVARETAAMDAGRIAALVAMFERFDYETADAEVRARALYFTQLGYVASQPNDPMSLRMSRISRYAELFTSVKPQERELERFFARRNWSPAANAVQKKGKSPAVK
jgi:hypothetical protein